MTKTIMTKTITTVVAASILALGLSGTGALAQDAMSTAPDLTSIDADQSGDVSFAEAQIAWPDITTEAFAAADADGSGALSQDEFDAYVASLPAAQ